MAFDVGNSVFGERPGGGPMPTNGSSMWGAGGKFAAFPRNLDLAFNAPMHDHAAGAPCSNLCYLQWGTLEIPMGQGFVNDIFGTINITNIIIYCDTVATENIGPIIILTEVGSN